MSTTITHRVVVASLDDSLVEKLERTTGFVDFFNKKGYQVDFSVDSASDLPTCLIWLSNPPTGKSFMGAMFGTEGNQAQMRIMELMDKLNAVGGVIVSEYGTTARPKPNKLLDFLKELNLIDTTYSKDLGTGVIGWTSDPKNDWSKILEEVNHRFKTPISQLTLDINASDDKSVETFENWANDRQRKPLTVTMSGLFQPTRAGMPSVESVPSRMAAAILNATTLDDGAFTYLDTANQRRFSYKKNGMPLPIRDPAAPKKPSPKTPKTSKTQDPPANTSKKPPVKPDASKAQDPPAEPKVTKKSQEQTPKGSKKSETAAAATTQPPKLPDPPAVQTDMLTLDINASDDKSVETFENWANDRQRKPLTVTMSGLFQPTRAGMPSVESVPSRMAAAILNATTLDDGAFTYLDTANQRRFSYKKNGMPLPIRDPAAPKKPSPKTPKTQKKPPPEPKASKAQDPLPKTPKTQKKPPTESEAPKAQDPPLKASMKHQEKTPAVPPNQKQDDDDIVKSKRKSRRDVIEEESPLPTPGVSKKTVKTANQKLKTESKMPFRRPPDRFASYSPQPEQKPVDLSGEVETGKKLLQTVFTFEDDSEEQERRRKKREEDAKVTKKKRELSEPEFKDAVKHVQDAGWSAQNAPDSTDAAALECIAHCLDCNIDSLVDRISDTFQPKPTVYRLDLNCKSVSSDFANLDLLVTEHKQKNSGSPSVASVKWALLPLSSLMPTLMSKVIRDAKDVDHIRDSFRKINVSICDGRNTEKYVISLRDFFAALMCTRFDNLRIESVKLATLWILERATVAKTAAPVKKKNVTVKQPESVDKLNSLFTLKALHDKGVKKIGSDEITRDILDRAPASGKLVDSIIQIHNKNSPDNMFNIENNKLVSFKQSESLRDIVVRKMTERRIPPDCISYIKSILDKDQNDLVHIGKRLDKLNLGWNASSSTLVEKTATHSAAILEHVVISQCKPLLAPLLKTNASLRSLFKIFDAIFDYTHARLEAKYQARETKMGLSSFAVGDIESMLQTINTKIGKSSSDRLYFERYSVTIGFGKPAQVDAVTVKLVANFTQRCNTNSALWASELVTFRGIVTSDTLSTTNVKHYLNRFGLEVTKDGALADVPDYEKDVLIPAITEYNAYDTVLNMLVCYRTTHQSVIAELKKAKDDKKVAAQRAARFFEEKIAHPPFKEEYKISDIILDEINAIVSEVGSVSIDDVGVFSFDALEKPPIQSDERFLALLSDKGRQLIKDSPPVSYEDIQKRFPVVVKDGEFVRTINDTQSSVNQQLATIKKFQTYADEIKDFYPRSANSLRLVLDGLETQLEEVGEKTKLLADTDNLNENELSESVVNTINRLRLVKVNFKASDENPTELATTPGKDDDAVRKIDDFMPLIAVGDNEMLDRRFKLISELQKARTDQQVDDFCNHYFWDLKDGVNITDSLASTVRCLREIMDNSRVEKTEGQTIRVSRIMDILATRVFNRSMFASHTTHTINDAAEPITLILEYCFPKCQFDNNGNLLSGPSEIKEQKWRLGSQILHYHYERVPIRLLEELEKLETDDAVIDFLARFDIIVTDADTTKTDFTADTNEFARNADFIYTVRTIRKPLDKISSAPEIVSLREIEDMLDEKAALRRYYTPFLLSFHVDTIDLDVIAHINNSIAKYGKSIESVGDAWELINTRKTASKSYDALFGALNVADDEEKVIRAFVEDNFEQSSSGTDDDLVSFLDDVGQCGWVKIMVDKTGSYSKLTVTYAEKQSAIVLVEQATLNKIAGKLDKWQNDLNTLVADFNNDAAGTEAERSKKLKDGKKAALDADLTSLISIFNATSARVHLVTSDKKLTEQIMNVAQFVVNKLGEIDEIINRGKAKDVADSLKTYEILTQKSDELQQSTKDIDNATQELNTNFISSKQAFDSVNKATIAVAKFEKYNGNFQDVLISAFGDDEAEFVASVNSIADHLREFQAAREKFNNGVVTYTEAAVKHVNANLGRLIVFNNTQRSTALVVRNPQRTSDEMICIHPATADQTGQTGHPDVITSGGERYYKYGKPRPVDVRDLYLVAECEKFVPPAKNFPGLVKQTKFQMGMFAKFNNSFVAAFDEILAPQELDLTESDIKDLVSELGETPPAHSDTYVMDVLKDNVLLSKLLTQFYTELHGLRTRFDFCIVKSNSVACVGLKKDATTYYVLTAASKGFVLFDPSDIFEMRVLQAAEVVPSLFTRTTNFAKNVLWKFVPQQRNFALGEELFIQHTKFQIVGADDSQVKLHKVSSSDSDVWYNKEDVRKLMASKTYGDYGVIQCGSMIKVEGTDYPSEFLREDGGIAYYLAYHPDHDGEFVAKKIAASKISVFVNTSSEEYWMNYSPDVPRPPSRMRQVVSATLSRGAALLSSIFPSRAAAASAPAPNPPDTPPRRGRQGSTPENRDRRSSTPAKSPPPEPNRPKRTAEEKRGRQSSTPAKSPPPEPNRPNRTAEEKRGRQSSTPAPNPPDPLPESAKPERPAASKPRASWLWSSEPTPESEQERPLKVDQRVRITDALDSRGRKRTTAGKTGTITRYDSAVDLYLVKFDKPRRSGVTSLRFSRDALEVID